MDLQQIYNILEGFTHADVLETYQITKKRFSVVAWGTTLGISVSIFLLVKSYGEAILSAIGWKKGSFQKKPKWSELLTIFQPTFYVLIVVVAYPHLLSEIEKVLTIMSDSFTNNLGPEANLRDVWLKEAMRMQEQMDRTSAWDISSKLSIIINYYVIIMIKPFFILLEQDAYSMFLMLRYLYLLILELFGGIALALYIYSQTRSHTITWLKHMLFCYALLAVFMMANFFADTVMDVFIRNNSQLSYNILLIAFGMVVKLFLFQRGFNLLKQNVF